MVTLAIDLQRLVGQRIMDVNDRGPDFSIGIRLEHAILQINNPYRVVPGTLGDLPGQLVVRVTLETDLLEIGCERAVVAIDVREESYVSPEAVVVTCEGGPILVI